MFASITSPVPIRGDAELARLLASASSCGWTGADDADAIAERCAWPDALRDEVAGRSAAERVRLARGAESLLRCFGPTEGRADELRRLVAEVALRVSEDSRPMAEVGPAGDQLLLSAALGLLDLIGSAGHQALAVCVSATCSQPVLRTGTHARSTACSPGCANRSRVARHRAARRALE